MYFIIGVWIAIVICLMYVGVLSHIACNGFIAFVNEDMFKIPDYIDWVAEKVNWDFYDSEDIWVFSILSVVGCVLLCAGVILIWPVFILFLCVSTFALYIRKKIREEKKTEEEHGD